MKIGKLIATVLLLILLAYLVTCALGPKDLNVERSIKIEAASSEIYPLVNNLKNWEKWSSWYEKEPTMKLSYGDKTEGKGSIYAWDGENSGKGSLEILEAVSNKQIKTKLKFDGFDGASYGQWDFNESGNQTEVIWGMKGDDLPFMLRGMMLVMNQKTKMVADFDRGLANLKKLVEG